jgi:hypothetical protein
MQSHDKDIEEDEVFNNMQEDNGDEMEDDEDDLDIGDDDEDCA